MNTSTSTHRQLMDDAVIALTAAARLADGPDFAEFVTLAVTAAVANVGGVETALARRSGSWEASHVRDMLTSSVGHNLATLLEHRTETVTVTVRPDETLHDLGYWRLYDDDQAELTRRYDALQLPDTTLHSDGTTTGDPTPWTDEQEAAADAVNRLIDQVEQLRTSDLTAYAADLHDAAISAAAQLLPTRPVPVEVAVDLDWTHDAEPFDELTWVVLEEAQNAAPLPSSGIAARDYGVGADIATAERAAGRTPLQRITTTTASGGPVRADRRPGAH